MGYKSKTRPDEELYICLEQLDFSWFQDKVEIVKDMWGEGEPIDEIAQAVGRDCDEVFLLLMDLVRRRKIHKRDNGIFGKGRLRA